MRRSVPLALLVLGLVLALAGFSTAAAAEVTDSVTVSFTVKSHQVIEVTPPTVDFGEVWPDMTSPPSAQTVTVTCRSNVAWDLNYQAPADFGNALLPIGLLQYDGTSFVSGTQPLLTNQPKTSGSSANYSYSLDTDSIPWTADQGPYSAQIVYQLIPY